MINMLQKFPQVSFIISTHNRCEVLLHTLSHIQRCGLETSDFDIHVIDNASTDMTAARVRDEFPCVRLITLDRNQGPVAKNEALPHAMGRYVVFLDDDSYPIPGAIQRMIRHFEADVKLGAATFTVNLTNGNRECSAYPDVFIGCGVGLRRRALRAVGGLPDDFFMQAEEYDLSLRLIDAGYRVRTFDDLHVMHLKTPQARISARTMRLDVRNNLFVILRRFPREHIPTLGWDWMKRYWWIASSKGATGAFLYGIFNAILRCATGLKREPVSSETFEQFVKLQETENRLRDAIANESTDLSAPMKRVLLVDCGKNLFAYWRACQELGLQIVAIADRNLHHPARRYRGIRIVDDAAARKLKYDLVLISNLSSVHAQTRRSQWRITQDRPVIDLYESQADERPELQAYVARFIRETNTQLAVPA